MTAKKSTPKGSAPAACPLPSSPAPDLLEAFLLSPDQIQEYQKGDAKRHEQELQQRIADISPSVMTAVEVALREQERQLREAVAPFSMTAVEVALRERERQERQERESEAIRLPPPVFIPNLIQPHFVQPAPPASQPSGQPYSREEMAAWRRVVAVLSRTATPQKRKNMADRLSERARGQTCNEISMELGDVAKLFHPDSEERAASVLHVLQQACKSGELASYGGSVTVFQLVAWPECPPMAADSPLRFWLPDAPQLVQPAPAAGALDAESGDTVTEPASRLQFLAQRRSKHAEWTAEDRAELLVIFNELKGRLGISKAQITIAEALGMTSRIGVKKQIDRAQKIADENRQNGMSSYVHFMDSDDSAKRKKGAG